MKLSEEDLERINYLYKSFLDLLAQKFFSYSALTLKSALEFIHYFYSKLSTTTINTSNDNSLIIVNLLNNGILSLCGYRACRNTNAFLYDFLKKINLDPIFQCIYIDENNDWHIVTPIKANHLIVAINYNNQKYYLDLHNGLYFDSDLKTIVINKITIDIDELINNEILLEIKKIISKYVRYQEHGIKYIYTYD